MTDQRASMNNGNVIELARRTAEPLNAAEGLSAVSELRRRLDSFEAGYVEEAFDDGWSWSRIASCLGVSRQAAHRKYSGSLKAKRRRRLRRRATIPHGVHRIVRRAMAEAQIMGHRRVDAGHLLLGIAACDEGPAKAALEASGISMPRLREQVTRLYGGALLLTGPAELDAEPPPSTDQPRGLSLAPAARLALRESTEEAARLDSSELRPEHLLLAVLRPSQGSASKLLLRMGLLSEEVRDRLRAELTANSGT
jgi:ATP-dependent Clp protease ATP-binding subunit ClpA